MQHQNTQDARLQHLAMLSQLMNQGQQTAPHQPDIMSSLASLYGMSREQQLLPAQLQGLQLANQKEQAGLSFLPQQQQMELATGQAKIGTENAAAGASGAEIGYRKALTDSLPSKVEAAKDRGLGSSIMFAELAKQMGWSPDEAQAYRDRGILPGSGNPTLNMSKPDMYDYLYGPQLGAYGQPGATPPKTNADVIGHEVSNFGGLLGYPFRMFVHGLNSPAGQPIQPLPLWPQ